MESKFAKGQLTKHGWKDGAGLGRDETGIKDAIKVNMKQDTKGVGFDTGEEFTFHWWDNVFNKAASNITVETKGDGVALKKSTETNLANAKMRKTYDNKAMLYGRFIQGATMSNSQTVTEEEEESEEEEFPSKTYIIPENEDEIFRKCGGLTGHKAARHGHQLNGKLARIQQQEQMLLEQMKSKSTNQSEGNHSLQSKVAANENTDTQILQEQTSDSVLKDKKSKKKKKDKKRRNGSNDETTNNTKSPEIKENSICVDIVSVKSKSKKSKKRKNKDNNDGIEEENNIEKKQKLQDKVEEEDTNNNGDRDSKRKKKKKKNKSKDQEDL